MGKVSNQTELELNKLALGTLYYILCLGVVTLFLLLRNSSPDTGLLFTYLPIITVMFLGNLCFWICARHKIMKKNEKDIWRGNKISSCYTRTTNEKLRASRNWLEEQLSSAHFANEKERDGIETNSFFYETILDEQETGGGENVQKEIKTSIQLSTYPQALTRRVIKIEEINYLTFLPGPRDTKQVLSRIFSFLKDKYRLQNGFVWKDYTFKALESAYETINKHIINILLKNHKEALRIFLSKEEFQIAGGMFKNLEGGVLFLITAIKTKDQEIVLFPDKTIKDIFCELDNILS